MRERRSFAQRTKVLKSDEARRKIFLVYEGEKTEGIYFDAVNELRACIGVHPLIELVPLDRSYSEEGWSNPQKILERVVSDIEAELGGQLLCEMLLNRIMDYLIGEDFHIKVKVKKRIIWDYLVEFCQNELRYSLDSVVTDVSVASKNILDYFCGSFHLPQIVDGISDSITKGGLGYADGFDKICLIVDRDRGSFTETQYDSVITKCQEKDIGLFVSNPCFEFWLLLHFDEIKTLDREKLLDNPKVTSKKRYTEAELCKLLSCYCKNSYDAKKLIKSIDRAIENERTFCEDVQGLKNCVGSNIGVLIRYLREDCCGSHMMK